jgi:hypothetical protein
MTNEDQPPGPVRRELRTGRLEAFSDGVFAIAITLLIPVAAVIGYLAVALYYIIPFRSSGSIPFRRRRRDGLRGKSIAD